MLTTHINTVQGEVIYIQICTGVTVQLKKAELPGKIPLQVSRPNQMR